MGRSARQRRRRGREDGRRPRTTPCAARIVRGACPARRVHITRLTLRVPKSRDRRREGVRGGRCRHLERWTPDLAPCSRRACPPFDDAPGATRWGRSPTVGRAGKGRRRGRHFRYFARHLDRWLVTWARSRPRRHRPSDRSLPPSSFRACRLGPSREGLPAAGTARRARAGGARGSRGERRVPRDP